MAPKSKRKATSESSSVKSPRPRKKINLNDSALTTPSRSTRSSQKAALEREQQAQEKRVESHSAAGSSKEAQSTPPPSGGLASRFSISSLSLPFLGRTPSFSLSTVSANGTALQNGVFNRLMSGLPPVRSLFSKTLKMPKGTSRDKGKSKQHQVDEEEDHLSAQESARMIEILDTPVSLPVRTWPLVDNGADEGYLSDGQSTKGVESLLDDEKGLDEIQDSKEDATREQVDPLPELEVQANGTSTGDTNEEEMSKDLESEGQRGSSPLIAAGPLHLESVGAPAANGASELELGLKAEVLADDDGVVVHEGQIYDEISTPERVLAPEEGGVESEEDASLKEAKEQITSNGLDAHEPSLKEQEYEEHNALDSNTKVAEEEPQLAEQEDSIAEEQERGSATQATHVEDNERSLPEDEAPSANEVTEDVTEQVGHLSVEDDAEASQMSYQQEQEHPEREDDSDEEDQILIPNSQDKRRVIDLTDSVSPEPEESAVVNEASRTTPLRQKPSGFFSGGLLAREKEREERGSSYSAARVIQQLGRRQVSSPSVSSRVSHRSASGFRKKDPIFSQARKSKARNIAHGKVDDILTSLKRYVKKTMHTPFIDDLLKKRIALAKMTMDDTPEDEIQIRHLREILKRSTYSLRPARRQLKEQERLAQEAKLLRKRALGIMGRQPFPASLSPEQDAFVTETFKKQGNIAQMPGANVQARDIIKLSPKTWLNDEVINFYTKLILKRSDEAILKRASAKEAKKRLAAASYTNEEDRTKDITKVRDVKKIWNGVCNVWIFNSFFWQKLTEEGYKGISKWTRKVDIFTKDLILLPINQGQLHWVCAAINMRLCRFEYYDSLFSPNPKAFTILRNYLESEYADKKKGSAGTLDLSGWKNHFSRRSPHQVNGFDCGMFVCMTLEQLSRRSPADGEREDINVEMVVKRSKELAEERAKSGNRVDRSPSVSDDDENNSREEEEDEDWNFSQADMPYLRRRMVYEIAKVKLLDE
jgi:sentrin-specific protease 1